MRCDELRNEANRLAV